jgi:hypothetical protein
MAPFNTILPLQDESVRKGSCSARGWMPGKGHEYCRAEMGKQLRLMAFRIFSQFRLARFSRMYLLRLFLANRQI